MASSSELPALDVNHCREAHRRIAPYVHATPVLTCATLDALAGARLYFKAEHLQKSGSFKFRGASNAILTLSPEQAKRGVATHSSGNHAQALALAAGLQNISAHVVMPSDSSPAKIAAAKSYGAKITICQATLEARESALNEVLAQTGATFIHPYDDPRIIAGQATAFLELREQAPALDVVIAPVGGGGLLSGTAIAAGASQPTIRVWGAEPELAGDAHQSLKTGVRQLPLPPITLADGLRTGLGVTTFPIIKQRVERIVLVSETEILHAMQLLWERAKFVVEPSGAVPLAAVLAAKSELRGKTVGIILSGGNVATEEMIQMAWGERESVRA